jgi:hypothetical protein
MYSVSMTARLGLAAVLAAIAVVILAHSKDQAPVTNRCKAGNCAVSTANIDQVVRKNIPKGAQQSNRSADSKMILNKKDKSVQAIAVTGSEPVSKKSAQRLAKKPAQRLAKPPQRLVEGPEVLVEAPQVLNETPQQQFRRSRRDDGYTW